MAPQVDLVIVTYNSMDVIADLLDSLPAALGEIQSNVVIVDNGSSDKTVELLTARNDCTLIRSSNIGYAAGINRGVRESGSADSILILNPDTRLHPDSVAPMLDALRVPGVGIVAPKIVTAQGGLDFSLRRDPTLLRALGLARTKMPVFSEHVQEPSAYEYAHEVDWAVGAVLMMSRQCFDSLGGWEESFFLYSEETDLSLRARGLGFSTRYEPAAVAMHIGGGSGRNGKTQAMQAINRVRLYRRHHNSISTWAYYGLTVASETLWGLRGHPESAFAAASLLRPSLRPPELKCAARLLPGW